MTKLHGNAVPEAEFRARILRAVATLKLEGRPVTFATLRSVGMRGSDRRVRETVEAMRRAGEIDGLTLVARPRDLVPDLDDMRERRAITDRADQQAAARQRSAEWVAEHRARWARIRRIGEPRNTRNTRNGGAIELTVAQKK